MHVIGDTSPELDSRVRLLDLSVGVVEDLRRGGGAGQGPEGFCADFQVCLPYRGLFVWHVCGDDIVGDPNQIVFVRGGESYRVRGANPGGYAELIITPDVDLLSEIAHLNGCDLDDHPLFRKRVCPAHPSLQCFRAQFRQWALYGEPRDGLGAEELVIELLRSALGQTVRRPTASGARTARLIRHAKEFLEGHLSGRIRLADISRAVGASAAYLTDRFTQCEGVSLHQYLTQLRLARALVELPHASDLTSLALDLGFSSHSHFTFAFRRAFDCTPSQFRAATRACGHPRGGRIAGGRDPLGRAADVMIVDLLARRSA